MVPNPQAQRLRLETINALLSHPVQSSGSLTLPPILFNRPSEGASAQVLSPSTPPSPLSSSHSRPIINPAIIDKVSALDFSWSNAELNTDTHVIDTKFLYEMNAGIPYSRTDEKLRYEYTQRQRRATLAAIKAKSIDELRRLLCQQLQTGKRNLKDWVELDSAILNG